jgi:hypothetical protein
LTAETPRQGQTVRLSTLKHQDKQPLKHQDLQVIDTNNLFKQIVGPLSLCENRPLGRIGGLSLIFEVWLPKAGKGQQQKQNLPNKGWGVGLAVVTNK